MKSSRQKKALIPLFSILFLISIPFIYNTQIKALDRPEGEITLAKEEPESTNSGKPQRTREEKLTLTEAIQITKKDGSQSVIPVITGEVFWWIVLTILVGTLIILGTVIVAPLFFNKQGESEERNQYLSEALPDLIKGITIVYIVIAVLLLSILGIISAEGTLSILAGISGYVLGKEKVKDKLPTKAKPTEPKPTEPNPTEPNPTEPNPTEPNPTEPKP